ncbi:MAG: PD-(D/E)XK nuclease family protein [Clostridia bacterium]|nr:PD-(D/E)XK nuclease family protein [Clostridia bacterium]
MLTVCRDDFLSFPFLKAIAECVKSATPAVLLVPEGQALAVEREAATSLPASAPLTFEVSNFTRLADRAFRTFGGISYRYADRVAEALLMWRVLDDYAPFLTDESAGNMTDTVKEKLAAMNELWAAGLSPEELLRVAALTEGEVLRTKLSELAEIMGQYEGALAEGYGSHAKDLDKLLGILQKTTAFRDTTFFVSGFTSFTARELLILVELARHTAVTVALPLPAEDERALCYEETLTTFRALRALCAKAGVSIRRTEGERANRAEALRYAQRMLFRADRRTEAFEGDGTALSLLRAPDPFSACAEIAAEIARRVREGARYRDFTVIARESDPYDGILDAALAAEGIPFFFATETALPELSLCKMILSAYATVLRGWRQSDLLSYIKCGYTGVTRDDCDRFELYLSFWRLHGRALSEDTPFDMHPRGYEGIFTESDSATLALVNRVRTALLSPLWRLAGTARAQMTVREHTEALYRFLCDVRAEEALLQMARRERLAGRVRESEVLSRLFPVLCGLFDQMVEILGESRMTGARFTELLAFVFSSSHLGSLPTAFDAVTVGNADTVYPDEEKTVFLLGVNEGEFPASVPTSQGAFLEEERRSLLSLGVEVGKDPAVRASREQFVFLRALCAGKRTVVLSYEASALGGATRPHDAFVRLEALFGKARHTEELAEIFSARAATEQFPELAGTPKGDAIGALLSGDPAYARHILAASLPLSETACRVGAETASALFPDTIYTSQSRIDKYLDCPFSYYCRYVLRLPENERAAIRTMEIGTTMHAILQTLFEKLAEEERSICDLSPEELNAIVDEACHARLLTMCPESQRSAPRIAHLFTRIRRAAGLVVRDLQLEFSHADFTPRFCELEIGGKDAPESLVFCDGEGKRVSFGGFIDRIDTYRAPTGETFVRVVDYKSSPHDFSRDELRRGRNLQMFVYLCALWKSKNEGFRARLSLAPDEALLPAGVVYSKSSPALPTLSAPAPKETLEADAMAKLERSGFFLREEDVLRAMDDTFSGHLVPATRDGKGDLKYKKEKAFGSLVEFGEMLDEAEEAVCSIAARMREGVADALPDEEAKYPPCSGCAFLPLCRREL